MAVERPQAGAVAVRVAAGKAAPAADLGAELHQQLGRRQPFQLQSIVVQPAAEKRLVGERRILEIPRVLMDLVLVADAREKASALQREAAAQRERLEERLFHLDLVIRREGR